MVVASVDSGQPAIKTACLAGACPTPADTTLPIYTSSTWLGLIPIHGVKEAQPSALKLD